MPTPANWRLWGKLATSGPASLTRGRWRTGRTFWVDSINGDDANAGTSKEKPKQTLRSVFLQTILAGDKIVLMPNCIVTEPSAEYAVSVHGIEIVGQGLGSEMAQIVRSGGSAQLFFVASGGDLLLNNIKLPAGTASAIKCGLDSGARLFMRDCVVELGSADANYCIGNNGGEFRADNTTFRVTSGRPNKAISCISGYAELADCVIDGGVFGWADSVATPYAQMAVEVISGVFISRNTRLLNHSDIYVHAEDNACVIDIETQDEDGESLIGEDCSVLYGVQPICSTAFALVSAATRSVGDDLVLDLTFSPGAILYTAVITKTSGLSLGVKTGTWNYALDSGRHTVWTWTPDSPLTGGDYTIAWTADNALCSQDSGTETFSGPGG